MTTINYDVVNVYVMISFKNYLIRILLLVFLRLYDCKEEVILEETPQVEVRAVFISCEPEEWRGSASENEAKRFEREEIFKHGALRDCQKKLALMVKLGSNFDSSSDEYIPVEHVFEGPGKKRVRLLNPYVLRLRRELPLQAYKLRRIEIVSGILTKSVELDKDDSFVKRGRIRRDTPEYDILKAITIRPWSTFDPENKCRRGQHFSVLPKYYNNSHSCNINYTRKLEKRQEHNVVIDDNKLPWPTTPVYQKEKDDSGYYNSNDNLVTANFFNDNTYKDIDNTIYKNGFDKAPQENIFPRDINNWSKDNNNIAKINKIGSDTITSGNMASHKIRPGITKERSVHIDKSKSRKSESYYENDTNEKYFAMFQILEPELWYSVHIQLFEKISTPEGNTVWNDLTKGEPARLTSTYPEWSSQDVNIKYRPTTTLKRDDYTLPLKTLVLLIPIHSENVDNVEDDDGSVVDNNNGDYIVIPMEDVTRIEIDKNILKKSSDNASDDDESVSSKRQKYQRVSVRMSRQVLERTEDLKILSLGSDLYLTLPHRRHYGALIDLEARADENQLVRVGSFGRIVIAVSDNTRVSRTTLTAQATNTGLAAARFRVKILDCGPELSNILLERNQDSFVTDAALLAPKHTRRFKLEFTAQLPTDTAHCSVGLVNEDDEVIAIRDVSIKRGDRCFCVWYCDCVCLTEDPKLLCREMPETRLLAAGLSARERPRRSRSIHCPDSVALDIVFSIIGVILLLFALGFTKACLGLLFRGVGSWGLDCLVELPRKLQYYHESSLRSRPVQYDEDGWPIHPDTRERTVRLISLPMEFLLNLLFFVILPCLVIVNAVNIVIFYIRNSSNDANTIQRSMDTKRDFQNLVMRRRRRRRKILRKWMTPQAEKLSKDLWRAGLASEGLAKHEIMQPLLQEHCYPTRTDDYLSSFADSEQDDTEYVLTQMQKSKESLARNGKELNEVPTSTRKRSK